MISKEEARHIAKLARLELSPAEEAAMQKDLSAILDYFGLLKKAPKPAANARQKGLAPATAARPDKAFPNLLAQPADLLAAAPDQKDGYIKVKAIF